MSEFAGALRERIVIEQRRDQGRDPGGGTRVKWDYDGAVWAAVAPLIPADLIAGDVLSALPRWQVTMRKREGISPATRIVWRGRYLKIRSVESDPRTPAQMILTTEEQR